MEELDISKITSWRELQKEEFVMVLRHPRFHHQFAVLLDELEEENHLSLRSKDNVVRLLFLIAQYLAFLPSGPFQYNLIIELKKLYHQFNSHNLDGTTGCDFDNKRVRWLLREYGSVLLTFFPMIPIKPTIINSITTIVGCISSFHYNCELSTIEVMMEGNCYCFPANEGYYRIYRGRYQQCIKKKHLFTLRYYDDGGDSRSGPHEVRSTMELIEPPNHYAQFDVIHGYCERCNRHAMFQCHRCKRTKYCSQQCQVEAHFSHRLVCRE